jgi:hypothetical protein
VTAPTATRWEPDVQAVCDRCLEAASIVHLRRLVVHGIGLDMCAGCIEYLGRQPVVDRALALRRLARLYAGGAAA